MTGENTKPHSALPIPAKRQPPLSAEAVPRPNLLSAAAALLAGFLFGGISFPPETHTAGIALTAALPSYSLFAALGVLARTVLDGKTLLFGVAALCLAVLRVLFGFAMEGRPALSPARSLPDSAPLRALTAAVFALGTSLIEVLLTGITLLDILTFVAGTVTAVAFTFLLAFFFDKDARRTPAFEAGLGAAAFLTALSLADLSISGFSVGLCVSFALTLYAGYLGEPTRSAAVGLLCGLACGGTYAPVFALSGLIAGIFFSVNGLLAAAGALTVLLCGSFYFSEGQTALSHLPELVTAAALVTVPAAFHILPTFIDKAPTKLSEDIDCADLVARKKEELRERRMTKVAGSMTDLSEVFRGLSERFRRPEPEKLTEKCIAVFRRHCEDCPMDCPCRDLASVEKEALRKRLASRLMSCGRLDREHLYELTKAKCPKLDEIASEISVAAGKMLADAIKDDKTGVFAFDYEAMAELFADAAAEGTVGFDTDKVLSDRVRRRLFQAGFEAENILVCGDRKKYVIATGENISRSTHAPAEIKRVLEEVCHMPFRDPEYLLENGKSALVAESAPRFFVEHTERQVRKRGEALCGDSVNTFHSDDDFFYSCICDGMGSGKEAALTAGICRVFLEKMLSCGNKKSTTFEMLNHLLLSKGTECFATVDLVEIDLCLGVASFIKSGAVPSYILRQGHIYKIASGTLPLGIVEETSAELTEFELQDGDTVILCSDGIASDIELSSSGDPAWFLTLLSDCPPEELSDMADRILDAAGRAATRSDDMTVEIIRIRELPAKAAFAA